MFVHVCLCVPVSVCVSACVVFRFFMVVSVRLRLI